MHLLNRFFGPFAALLILSAMYFSNPDPAMIWASIGILVLSVASNAWIARNCYRFIHWTRALRYAQIWLNFLWALAFFFLLGSWWGPMWLLFIVAPASAAMYAGFQMTLTTSVASSLSLLGVYWLRGVEGSYAWGQAFIHALFIVFFSLFICSLAQSTLKGRSQ